MEKLLLFLCVTMFFSISACKQKSTPLSTSAIFTNAVSSSLESKSNVQNRNTEVKNINETVSREISDLFLGYGWEVSTRLGYIKVELPKSLVTNAEDSPMKLYWMRAMILSNDIGFDLDSYLGELIDIEVYNVIGERPEKYIHPSMDFTRGIVFRNQDGFIIGAYIDTGRHAGISYTLKGRDVEDIMEMSFFEYWQQKYYDSNDPINITAKNRTVEEVISRYFEAVATGDVTMQLSTLSMNIKLQSLFTNIDNSIPFNDNPELYKYLDGVQVLSIEKLLIENENDLTSYAVRIDAKVSSEGKAVLGHDGEMTRFVIIGEENGRFCVFGDGTGP